VHRQRFDFHVRVPSAKSVKYSEGRGRVGLGAGVQRMHAGAAWRLTLAAGGEAEAALVSIKG
jgi:hypothetical protein